MMNQDIAIKWANCANPHDEAYRLILYRSYDIKLSKTGNFGVKCTKFIPFAWKYPQAILRASCRKAGCAFLLQREFSPLAVRFWEPIASLDRQNRSNFRRKISARETYSPPPFIIDSRKIWKERKYFPWASLSASTTATTIILWLVKRHYKSIADNVNDVLPCHIRNFIHHNYSMFISR